MIDHHIHPLQLGLFAFAMAIGQVRGVSEELDEGRPPRLDQVAFLQATMWASMILLAWGAAKIWTAGLTGAGA